MRTNSIYRIAVIEGVIPAMAKRAQYSPGFRRGVGDVALNVLSKSDTGKTVGDLFEGDYTDDLIAFSKSDAARRFNGFKGYAIRNAPDFAKRWALENPFSKRYISSAAQTAVSNAVERREATDHDFIHSVGSIFQPDSKLGKKVKSFVGDTARTVSDHFRGGPAGWDHIYKKPESKTDKPEAGFVDNVKKTWNDLPTAGKWAIGAGGLALGLGAIKGMFGGGGGGEGGPPVINNNIYTGSQGQPPRNPDIYDNGPHPDYQNVGTYSAPPQLPQSRGIPYSTMIRGTPDPSARVSGMSADGTRFLD